MLCVFTFVHMDIALYTVLRNPPHLFSEKQGGGACAPPVGCVSTPTGRFPLGVEANAPHPPQLEPGRRVHGAGGGRTLKYLRWAPLQSNLGDSLRSDEPGWWREKSWNACLFVWASRGFSSMQMHQSNGRGGAPTRAPDDELSKWPGSLGSRAPPLCQLQECPSFSEPPGAKLEWELPGKCLSDRPNPSQWFCKPTGPSGAHDAPTFAHLPEPGHGPAEHPWHGRQVGSSPENSESSFSRQSYIYQILM